MIKEKYLPMYMGFAEVTSRQSYAVRKKVGAVIVTDTGIVLPGYNGTPSGFDNCCEYTNDKGELVTKPEVLHAESNALAKAGKEGVRLDGATLFVTLMPCIDCAKLMYQNGIKTVYYKETYRCDKGVQFLTKSGIEVFHFPNE